jgi:CelD/BcsL family acetyltransferase involved in cellulose biosynthesis
MKSTLELITKEESFYHLENEWNSLLQESEANSIFLTWEWISTWWSYFGDGCQLWIVVARSPDSNNILGLAPLYMHQSTLIPGFLPHHHELAFLGANEVAPDHLDFIIRKGYEHIVASELFDYIYSNANCDILRFESLSSKSPFNNLLKSRLSSWGNNLILKTGAVLQLPNSWETYHATLGKKLRKNLRKDTQKLERDHPGQVQLSRANNQNEIKATLQALFHLANKVSEMHGRVYTLGSEVMKKFHYQLASTLHNKNWVRIYNITIGDEIIAALYSYQYNNVISGYQMAYDLSWKNYHPGMQILAHSIQQSIVEEAQVYDFLRGEHSYLTQWTNEQQHDYYYKLGYSIKGKILVSLYAIAYHLRLWILELREKLTKSR